MIQTFEQKVQHYSYKKTTKQKYHYRTRNEKLLPHKQSFSLDHQERSPIERNAIQILTIKRETFKMSTSTRTLPNFIVKVKNLTEDQKEISINGTESGKVGIKHGRKRKEIVVKMKKSW